MHLTKNPRLFTGSLLVLLALLGFFVFLFNQATRLQKFSMNPITSHLEILVLLVGLAAVGSVGVWGLSAMWKGRPKSFAYDIGLRLVLMGDLVGLLAGLADYIGIGVHHHLPYFGPYQTAGVFLGLVLMATGFLLMFPWQSKDRNPPGQ
jgi:hypothetical protein